MFKNITKTRAREFESLLYKFPVILEKANINATTLITTKKTPSPKNDQVDHE